MRLLLIILVFGFQTGFAAQKPATKKNSSNAHVIITFEEFMVLKKESQTRYIETLREAAIVLGGTLQNVGAHEHDFIKGQMYGLIFQMFTPEQAHAANVGDSCVFAGWPATFYAKSNGALSCGYPSSSDLGHLNGSESSKIYSLMALKCRRDADPGERKIPCNPILFGGSDRKPVCVKADSSASANCKENASDAAKVVESLLANPDKFKKMWAETQVTFDKTCTNPTTGDQTRTCELLKRRLTEVREQIGYPFCRLKMREGTKDYFLDVFWKFNSENKSYDLTYYKTRNGRTTVASGYGGSATVLSQANSDRDVTLSITGKGGRNYTLKRTCSMVNDDCDLRSVENQQQNVAISLAANKPHFGICDTNDQATVTGGKVKSETSPTAIPGQTIDEN